LEAARQLRAISEATGLDSPSEGCLGLAEETNWWRIRVDQVVRDLSTTLGRLDNTFTSGTQDQLARYLRNNPGSRVIAHDGGWVLLDAHGHSARQLVDVPQVRDFWGRLEEFRLASNRLGEGIARGFAGSGYSMTITVSMGIPGTSFVPGLGDRQRSQVNQWVNVVTNPTSVWHGLVSSWRIDPWNCAGEVIGGIAFGALSTAGVGAFTRLLTRVTSGAGSATA
jgi:hypothetical protein